MKDDCRKCVYLPLNENAFGSGPSALEEEINGLELIHSLARGRKEKEDLSQEIKRKKDKLGRKRKSKKDKKVKPTKGAPAAYTPPPNLAPTYRPNVPSSTNKKKKKKKPSRVLLTRPPPVGDVPQKPIIPSWLQAATQKFVPTTPIATTKSTTTTKATTHTCTSA